MMKKKLLEILKGERPIIDVWYYLIGNYRYWLYYRKRNYRTIGDKNKPILMRKHIWEQINYRIFWMDNECYYDGSCKLCGCETTALQMADKACDKPCYPSMMNVWQWDFFNTHNTYKDKNGKWRRDITGKPILVLTRDKDGNYV